MELTRTLSYTGDWSLSSSISTLLGGYR